jgi:hypothetical protein
VGALTVTITGLPSPAVIIPGGPAVPVTATVTNATARLYTDVAPLVSMGYCDCTVSSLMPSGTLQELSQEGSWHSVAYVSEGFGTDFLTVAQVPAITLAAGAVMTFYFRVAFARGGDTPVHAGGGSIDVTLVRSSTHTQLGASSAASAPIQVRP